MTRSLFWILAAASAMAGALSACGPANLDESELQQGIADTTTVPKGTLSRNFIAGAHIMPMQGTTPVVPLPTEPLAAKLKYYGGHVIASAKVVPVYWGTGTMQIPSEMHGFYSAVTNHPHMDWLSEYDTNITAVDGSMGTNQHIGRGTVDANDYTITPSITSKNITDDDISSELSKQIDAGKLPTPTPDTIYMIHFPLGVHISLGGSGSCSVFCAYHSTLSKAGKSVYYSVLPYLGPGSGCDGGCGSAATLLGNHTSVASHELIEAVTDGEIGLVTGSIGKPAAWYDSVNGEIGDICNASQGFLSGTTAPGGGQYVVQKEWSNQQNACIVDKGAVMAPTVSLTAPTAGSRVSGNVTVSANASETGDTISKVDFYADGTLIASDTTSPYSVTWDSTKVGNGNHSLTAKATDSHARVGTSSAVGVTVANGGDTTAPTVSVTAPTAGTTLTGTVTLTATATDPDDPVAKVDFYVGTTLVGTDTTAPYSLSWDSTKVMNGTYSITAKGTDSNGNVGTSTAVSVTVSNGGGGQNEAEPNNVYTSANAITDPAGKVTGFISTTSDTDFFKVMLPAGQTLTVDLIVPPGVDYDLYIYNSTPNVIAKSINDVGLPEHAAIKNTGVGTIVRYIEVRGYAGSSTTTPYKLTATMM